MRTPQIQLSSLAKTVLLCLSLLIIPIQSHANDVSFTWTATPEPLIGYKLYYKIGTDNAPPYNGTGLIEGNSPILLGKVTSTTVTGLSVTETYHFTIVAYNNEGESSYSTIVPISSFPSPTINLMSQN